MKYYITGKVQENTAVAEDIYLSVVQAPEIARQCQPGQFINIYFSDSPKIFPRPFSVAGVDADNIRILYKVVGSQTTLMSQWQIDQQVKLLGPLGNCFDINYPEIEHILLGGGVGAAPLMFLRDVLYIRGIMPKFYLGAKTKNQLPFIEDEKSQLKLSTDDGSMGMKGSVIENLWDYLKDTTQPVQVYGCGPDPMMTALKKMKFSNNVNVFVSLEKTMACGLGLCQGCIVRNADENHEKHYSLVCKDGPVFNLNEIEFDD